MQDFETFFRLATGSAPHGYQARIARDGLPDLVQAPTGTGKPGVILAWLWRRLHGPDPGGTPRRLIYALPQRSLTDQVAGDVRRWLANLGLADEIALHVVMGARWESRGAWRDDPHKPAIIVGTADVLVSKALVRGFDLDRALFPIDFALVSNGAQWIVDEIGVSPQTTVTLRQLAGLAAALGTAEPSGLTCLSAVAAADLLKTSANPGSHRAVRLRRLPAEPGDYQALATQVPWRHRPGTLTLVVMNTVEAARAVYRHLRSGPVECVLLHQRFRGLERERVMAVALAGAGDRIIVATQVAEAGLDLDAAVLVTEAAPWPSLLLRAGRCNRSGRENTAAEICWVRPSAPFPYQQRDIDATASELDRLEGERLTAEALLARAVAVTASPVSVIGAQDLARLFDTAPDPSGLDADIAPYVRDAEDLDAEVAWATWTPGPDGQPDPEIRRPAAEYRSRVALGEVAALARDRAVWRFDRAAGGWTRLTGPSPSPLRPGELLLVNASDGGYDLQTGFDLTAPGPVPDAPELLTWAEQAEQAQQAEQADALGNANAADPDFAEPRRWQSIDEHSQQVRQQAAALLTVLAPALPPEAGRAVVVAGYLHDLGKAHEIWQDAICALAEDDEKALIAAGRPWAKSGGKGGPLLFADGVAFRHELASLLLIDGPLAALLAESPDPDLTRYLVLAHHGKLRVQVAEPSPAAVPADSRPPAPDGRPPAAAIRGLRPGAVSAIPAMLGQPATTLTVDLAQFQRDDDRSWTRTVHRLRDRYGPFVLAYLETLVRVADWRASGGRELPGR
jgi:CRISPR-associated endonuclease/helicase Cas3